MSASGKTGSWAILMTLVAVAVFSAVIPPFQSPDEFDHITRAYLLGKGSIVLDTPSGSASGGMVDTGLVAYMKVYEGLPFHPERKVSACDIATANAIVWTGRDVFRAAPGTGYYFPLIYLPQALALVAGEGLGLTVDASYRLARTMAVVAMAVLLAVSFHVFTTNPLAIALLVLPMSLFQMSSASIDGISTALAIFSVSVFLRMAMDRRDAAPWLFYALAASVALLATSRIHLVSLLLLVLYICVQRKRPRFFLACGLVVAFVIGWTVIAMLHTVDTRVLLGATPSDIFVYYLKNPVAFFRILFETLTSAERLRFYSQSFFGILGWVDAFFNDRIYCVFMYFLLPIALLSMATARSGPERAARLAVLCSAVLSILLMFFALLVTWTPHPARMIEGVQGRYFLVPMIFFSYAISGGARLDAGPARKIALALLLFLGLYAVAHTSWLLVKRYYLIDGRSPVVPLVMGGVEPRSGKAVAGPGGEAPSFADQPSSRAGGPAWDRARHIREVRRDA